MYFCYVHVGAEVVRVEFPAWVVKDNELLDTALSLMLAPRMLAPRLRKRVSAGVLLERRSPSAYHW
ncbi:MAG: hypothetical protein ACR2FS_20285 [Phormidesmis sp.]